MTTTRETIEAAFSGAIAAEDARAAVADAIGLLDRGEARLAEHGPDGWTVNGWLQQAILLHFRLQQMEVIEHGPFTYHDKIPLKGIDSLQGVRVVPPATVRQGAFVEAGAVLMPSYVNIGAYVGSGTMIDTWATVGSGAQVGPRRARRRRRRHRRRARAARRPARDHRGRRVPRLALHRHGGRASSSARR